MIVVGGCLLFILVVWAIVRAGGDPHAVRGPTRYSANDYNDGFAAGWAAHQRMFKSALTDDGLPVLKNRLS